MRGLWLAHDGAEDLVERQGQRPSSAHPLRSAEPLELRLVEVRDDRVDPPATNLHSHRVEAVELRAVLGPRLGDLVDVVDAPEPGDESPDVVVENEPALREEADAVRAGSQSRVRRGRKDGCVRRRVEAPFRDDELAAPDPPGDFPSFPARIETENEDVSLLRPKVAAETAQDRRLAGPLATDERVARSEGNRERDVEAGRDPPRARRDAVEENRRGLIPEGGQIPLRRGSDPAGRGKLRTDV